MYLIGTGKLWDEWVLCFYYFMGISQNLLIFLLKRYYEKQAHGEGGSKAVVEPLAQEAVVFEMPSLQQEAGKGSSGATPVGRNERRVYAERRQWFKRRVVGTKLDHEQLEAAGYRRVNGIIGEGKQE